MNRQFLHIEYATAHAFKQLKTQYLEYDSDNNSDIRCPSYLTSFRPIEQQEQYEEEDIDGLTTSLSKIRL